MVMEDAAPILIYIVDDEPALTDVLKLRLSACGYLVKTFNHPFHALDALEHDTPGLFILDFMMPDMDGFALCKEIRRRAHLRTIPVLLLTACDNRTERIRGFEAGIDDFMNKPYDAQELLTRVRNLLRKQDIVEEKIESERLQTLQDTAVTVSHEIMTPLTALSLTVQHMKRRLAGDTTLVADITTVEEALAQIESLVYKLQRVSAVATEEYIGGVSMINLNASV